MIIENTDRGFGIGKFTDGNGEACSIQESSAIRDEKLLWLGVNDPTIQFMNKSGWETFDPKALGHMVLISGRMHLTQSQIKELLPLLTEFAETGQLPTNTK